MPKVRSIISSPLSASQAVAAQRAGDLDPALDPHGLAAHLLVVLRGIEAALACLPTPAGASRA